MEVIALHDEKLKTEVRMRLVKSLKDVYHKCVVGAEFFHFHPLIYIINRNWKEFK